MSTATLNQNALTMNYPNGTNNAAELNLTVLKDAAAVLRSINHPLRQEILRLLDKHKGMTVTEIYIKLRLEQSVASQHLAILRNSGIVKADRDGKFIYYSLNIPRIRNISMMINDIV